MPDPFFIVGTERSGSNLLRLVLNSHSRLCAFLGVDFEPAMLRFFETESGRNAPTC